MSDEIGANVNRSICGFPASVQMDDDQFFAFCQANSEYRIERNADGEIAIMPPTGGETGRRNSALVTDLNIWARGDGTGFVFDSSTGFRLPNGSTRSPDAAWVSRERLASIGSADKDRFLPLAPTSSLSLRLPATTPMRWTGKCRSTAQGAGCCCSVGAAVTRLPPNALPDRSTTPKSTAAMSWQATVL